jgi:hypothetical protein
MAYCCDVDAKALTKFSAEAAQTLGYAPKPEGDFRKALESKDVDAISIATPDHWHAPMAIAALRAGKHVYVEKPCSHNPAEGQMLLETRQKYGRSFRWARSSALRHTPSKSSKILVMALWAGLISPKPGTAICGDPLPRERKLRACQLGLGAVAGPGSARRI